MGEIAITLVMHFLLCVLVEKAETHPSNQPLIHFNQPNLTVQADHVPMGSLLEKIARETGINIVLKGPADQPVSVSFSAVPLDLAIRRLLTGASIAFTYTSSPDGKGTRLTDVFVTMDAGSNTINKFVANADTPAQGFVPETNEVEDSATTELSDPPEMLDFKEIEAMLLREHNPEARTAAIQLMGNISGDDIERATDVLMIALKDNDPDVRVAALTALSAMPEEMAATRMLEAMNDPAPEVRAAAVMIVGSLPLISPVDLLERGLQDEDTRVRTTSIETVAKMESPCVLPLLTAASKDEDASVREAALRAIAIAKENGPDAEATNDASVGVQDVGLDIDRDEIATEG
jgi:hypothetical protein